MAKVPCKGCTLCCHGDAIRILAHEDPNNWRTEPHDHFVGERMLAHKENGDCVYLDDHGCIIHESKPIMCKTMDCRNIARNVSWTQARKMPNLNIAVWRKGKDLLKEPHHETTP